MAAPSFTSLIKPNPNKTEDQVDFADIPPTVNIHIESAPEGAASSPEGCKDTKGVKPGTMLTFLAKLSSAHFHKKAEQGARKHHHEH